MNTASNFAASSLTYVYLKQIISYEVRPKNKIAYNSKTAFSFCFTQNMWTDYGLEGKSS